MEYGHQLHGAGMTSRGRTLRSEIPPFSWSVGERKIMNHFVVRSNFRFQSDNLGGTGWNTGATRPYLKILGFLE